MLPLTAAVVGDTVEKEVFIEQGIFFERVVRQILKIGFAVDRTRPIRSGIVGSQLAGNRLYWLQEVGISGGPILLRSLLPIPSFWLLFPSLLSRSKRADRLLLR